MATEVTIDRVAYTIEKLESGTIRVTYAGGQRHPMQGPGTDGVHVFEVHPCQTRWYAYWNDFLPAPDRAAPPDEPRPPWWSSKGAKKRVGEKKATERRDDGATEGAEDATERRGDGATEGGEDAAR